MTVKRRIVWTAWVAFRYLRTKRKEKSNITVFLSVLGIAVGVAALIAVLAIMNGFQYSTIVNILELNSYHIRVDLPSDQDEAQAYEYARQIRELPGVRSVVPFSEEQTLVQGDFGDPRGVMVRALPSDLVRHDIEFRRKLRVVDGQMTLRNGQAVLGAELARNLGVRLGESIALIRFVGSGVLQPQEVRYTVGGIYRADYYEFEQTYILTGLSETANPDGNPGLQLGIKLDKRFDDRIIAPRLQGLLPEGASVHLWREVNRSIFGALRLEKQLMTLLLGMVFVVVGVNIFQSLRRSVIERTTELGTLKALGADPFSVQLVFMLEGAIIGFLGALLGGIAGYFLAENINTVVGLIGKILLREGPGSFLWMHIPVKMYAGEVASILVAAFLSAGLAGVVASIRVVKIRPAEVLRDE
ncbi:MAG: ABC transporter permease [Spirochaetaceae bacterium]|nr:MAG: ABC transporter permease [Spirochaetaceae bacterium]